VQIMWCNSKTSDWSLRSYEFDTQPEH